ncbi:oligosaccharide flippase family protein [Rubellimicrobium sp. CFH 75288]|uniref:oligosaccharide flippase family protein n=1 Tax=Rubellimicrobium sp. CFH 75288 TaxID=2697034 RepID=UPI001412025B|nr:oligosaccharide flippase family protein [Rubellimicrobium sp. CFH 75288]NAZ37822.1 oligosaccharide flippase family protein [Rubellimicrobium sp. CFH 75288]
MSAAPAATASLGARALRSSAITGAGFVAAQALRLGSNLLLTRLLFPEAFGLMALVAVVLTGLAMLSDIGLGPAVMGSRRGDDPDFLDTAWTVQALRGVLLWLAACALAPFLAAFWGEPVLALMLPVAAFALVIQGLNPTRLLTAHRHLRAGRVTLIELATQVVGLVAAAILAWITGSVWALVVSGLVAALAHLALLHLCLPGRPDRLRWEPAAARELVRFGQWILLATLFGFLALQADKIVLGRWLPLADFGLYNIGAFLATFPLLLGGAVAGRVLIPVYRDSPPAAPGAAGEANRRRIRRMRAALLGGLVLLVLPLALAGDGIVRLLYDPRYAGAGAVALLLAAAQGPALVLLSCDQAALAQGDSRRFFVYSALRAIFSTGGLLAGLALAGLGGAILGQAAGWLLAWPVLAWLLRPHRAWDPALDLAVLAVSGLLLATVLTLRHDAVAPLFG